MTTPTSLPTARTTANTRQEHLDDHNSLHAFYNAMSGRGLAGNDGGAWLVGTAYTTGNFVSYNNKIYVALQASTGQTPDAANSTYWRSLTLGSGGSVASAYKGAWSSATAYVVGDIVTRTGSSYIALLASTNVDPSSGSSSATWGVLAAAGATGATGPAGSAGSANAALSTVAAVLPGFINRKAGDFATVGTANTYVLSGLAGVSGSDPFTYTDGSLNAKTFGSANYAWVTSNLTVVSNQLTTAQTGVFPYWAGVTVPNSNTQNCSASIDVLVTSTAGNVGNSSGEVGVAARQASTPSPNDHGSTGYSAMVYAATSTTGVLRVWRAGTSVSTSSAFTFPTGTSRGGYTITLDVNGTQITGTVTNTATGVLLAQATYTDASVFTSGTYFAVGLPTGATVDNFAFALAGTFLWSPVATALQAVTEQLGTGTTVSTTDWATAGPSAIASGTGTVTSSTAQTGCISSKTSFQLVDGLVLRADVKGGGAAGQNSADLWQFGLADAAQAAGGFTTNPNGLYLDVVTYSTYTAAIKSQAGGTVTAHPNAGTYATDPASSAGYRVQSGGLVTDPYLWRLMRLEMIFEKSRRSGVWKVTVLRDDVELLSSLATFTAPSAGVRVFLASQTGGVPGTVTIANPSVLTP